MFDFFLRSSHSGLLGFAGSGVNVESDQNSPDGKFCFRKYENGHSDWNVTCHPNILYHVVRGKKSYGLWVKQWSEGIAECSFTKEEIIQEFTNRNLVIPKGLMKSFDDSIKKEKIKRYERDLRELERTK